jgi:uncharacterized repeat protein (TIGR04052 family)
VRPRDEIGNGACVLTDAKEWVMQLVSSAVRRVLLPAIALVTGAVACGDDAPPGVTDHSETDASTPASGEDALPDEASGADATTAGELDGGRTTKVEIEFEARVGDSSFECTSTYEVGSGSTRVMPLDFRMYLHDIALLTKGGEQTIALEQDGTFQSGIVAMLDFENDSGSCSNGTAPTHTTIVGEVPTGEYTGLTFKIGVPEVQNHVNPAQAPSPLNVEGMFWSWTTGYKFLRVDVMPMQATTADAGMEASDGGMAAPDAGAGYANALAAGFNVHLGSTMCAGDPTAGEAVTCQRANRPQIRLAKFDPSKHKIVVDLAALLATSDVSHNMGGQPGCMSAPSDPECPAVFAALGLALDTGESAGNPAFLRIANK